MRGALLALLVLAAGCGERVVVRLAGELRLPPEDDTFFSVAAGASAESLLPIIDRGLQTREKGPDATRFVVIRSMERHPPEVTDPEFVVVVGAGVLFPKGAMRIRKRWIASGRIDGTNEQLQTLGVSVAVERGASMPFEPEVAEAVGSFCEALAIRLPLHPDTVVAMGEVPFTRPHPADAAERALAGAARRRVPVPPADGRGTVFRADGSRVEITFERRDTNDGIRVGMMMRKRFDGEDRGMLFVYLRPDYRRFWMKNCFIPIDVAYIQAGVIDQILAMPSGAGLPQRDLPFYPSRAAVTQVLEMPAGWFDRRGIKKGDRIELR